MRRTSGRRDQNGHVVAECLERVRRPSAGAEAHLRSRLRPPSRHRHAGRHRPIALVLGDQDRVERARGGAALCGLGDCDVEEGVRQILEGEPGRLEEVEGERPRDGVRLVEHDLRRSLDVLQEEVVAHHPEQAECVVGALGGVHQRLRRPLRDRGWDQAVGARHALGGATRLGGRLTAGLPLAALAGAARYLSSNERGLGVAHRLFTAEARSSVRAPMIATLTSVKSSSAGSTSAIRSSSKQSSSASSSSALVTRATPDRGAERRRLRVAGDPLLARLVEDSLPVAGRTRRGG